MKTQSIPFYTVLYVVTLLCACKQDSIDLSDPNNISLKGINHQPTAVSLETPEFFDPMIIPADNQLTEEGIDLGRHLFYDPILSRDNSISCAKCHQQSTSFSDNLTVSAGIDGKIGNRSVASLLNVGYVTPAYFLDGRAETLESAIEIHIPASEILDANWGAIILKIQESDLYRTKFRKAFPIENTNEIDETLISKAIAQFLRTLVSANSNYDKSISSTPDGTELTELELDGYFVFFREQNFTLHPGCSHCHDSPYFAGDDYYNNGIDSVWLDEGRAIVTQNASDIGKFRAPTLRNIEFTAPYMHDGRFETLEEVIEYYQTGGHDAENLDQEITGFELSEYEKEALIAFLKSLSDKDFLENLDFSNPF